MTLRLAVAALASLPLALRAQGNDAIRINQVGFVPRGPKVAIVVDTTATRFAVVDLVLRDTVLRGALGPARAWAPSGEVVRVARFDAVRRPGAYAVVVPGLGRSYPFVVADSAVRPVARAAVKGFWFQRVSEPLGARWAGPWARAAGHPDTAVLVHPSAATATRPAGTVLRSPGGWYDAGDYNKYVVNSGISTWSLLAMVEQFPAAAARLDVDIPERGGALPDVLDEALVNVRWMRTMQDPADGGVYHKLTNAEFDALDATPAAAARGTTRYVVQKSTTATLDFAAVMAQASRVARRFPRALPGLADSLLAESRHAWAWATAHPDSAYDQERLNRLTDPDVNTGAYGDARLDDERRWAAAELWLATGDTAFRAAALPPAGDSVARLPSWAEVGTLGLWSLLAHRERLSRDDLARVSRPALGLARRLVRLADASAYAVPHGAPGDFVWGSTAVAANQGIALVQAWRLTGDSTFLRAAWGSLDYLLGRNATGHSFVTGVGIRTPLHPHHRPSVSDTVAAPVPGLLSGGPNPGMQDKCPGYPSTLPAKAWLDHSCSYASNEIAINWNAPLAYLAFALDAAWR